MLKRVLCFTKKLSGDGGAVTWSLQKVQEVRWASVSILYPTLGFDSSETYAAWQVSPHLIYVALSFNAYGPGKGCTAVGWLLLRITGFLCPDTWFCYRTISGFRHSESCWKSKDLDIETIWNSHIPVWWFKEFLSMMVLFHSNQSYYRGGGWGSRSVSKIWIYIVSSLDSVTTTENPSDSTIPEQ